MSRRRAARSRKASARRRSSIAKADRFRWSRPSRRFSGCRRCCSASGCPTRTRTRQTRSWIWAISTAGSSPPRSPTTRGRGPRRRGAAPGQKDLSREGPLRIGFDMDGVVADFQSAFHGVEARLFPADPPLTPGQPESEAGHRGDTLPAVRDATNPVEVLRRREAIWDAISATPDFWTTLRPTVEGAVARIHDMMLRHRWEVFFITQRPETDGDTVQRQTQRWLVAQGFDLPSVLVIAGSRGAAAGALRLDYHVDDSPQNCVDVMTAGTARPILVTSGSD